MAETFKEVYLRSPEGIGKFLDELKAPTALMLAEAEETCLIIPEKNIAVILYHYPHDSKLMTLKELKEYILE